MRRQKGKNYIRRDVCKGERHRIPLRGNFCEYGVAITSHLVSQIARRQRRSALHSRGKYMGFGARGRLLSTRAIRRATLPRFPLSSSSSSSFSSSSSSSVPLPSRGRSTNPSSSVIPRALFGSRTCLASGDSLIRSTLFAEPAAGSTCRRSEVPRNRVVADIDISTLRCHASRKCPTSVASSG